MDNGNGKWKERYFSLTYGFVLIFKYHQNILCVIVYQSVGLLLLYTKCRIKLMVTERNLQLWKCDDSKVK